MTTTLDPTPTRLQAVGPREPSGDRRRTPRYPLNLPVQIASDTGRLRDFSASGVLIETDRSYAPGSPISFSVVLGRVSAGPALTLRGEGRVIRTDIRGSRRGVAVEVTSYR
jgi:hypothetical protein